MAASGATNARNPTKKITGGYIKSEHFKTVYLKDWLVYCSNFLMIPGHFLEVPSKTLTGLCASVGGVTASCRRCCQSCVLYHVPSGTQRRSGELWGFHHQNREFEGAEPHNLFHIYGFNQSTWALDTQSS